MANISGDNGNNKLNGGSASDTISGFAGNDTMNGGGGNDILFGSKGADVLDGGANFDLAAYFDGGAQGIVANMVTGLVVDTFGFNDTLKNIEGIAGSEFGDVITGSAVAEHFNGRGGNDNIAGGGGNDTIGGGSGDDTIRGGLGQDSLTGSFGADTFTYDNANESTDAAPDVITDFATGVDRIDVSRIDADLTLSGNQAFDFITGSGGFTDAGQVRVLNGAGGTLVQFNMDNNLAADFEILLEDTPLNVTEANFIL